MDDFEVAVDSLAGVRLLTVTNGPESAMGVTKMVGWYGVSAPKSDPRERALAHGAAMPARRWRPGRPWSLEGWIVAGDRPGVHVVRDALAGVVGGDTLVRVTVTEGGLSTSRVCGVESLEVDGDMGLHASPWAVDFFAPDPRRYGPPTVFAAGASVWNAGNAPTSPILRVTGPAASGFTVTESVSLRQVRYALAVAAGQTVTIDASVGFATVGGVASLGLRKFEWPEIPATASRYYSATAGTLAVESRSAWW